MSSRKTAPSPGSPASHAPQRGPAVGDPAEYRQHARVLKAIGNPARLQIIDRLSQGECSVRELTKLVGLDQTTVSKYLAQLDRYGIVEDRRDGNQAYYRLAMPCVMDLFTCTRRILDAR